jgi:hypothetical protein
MTDSMIIYIIQLNYELIGLSGLSCSVLLVVHA